MKWRESPDFIRTITRQEFAEGHLIMEDKIYILSTLFDYNFFGETYSEVAFLDTTLNSSEWDHLPSLESQTALQLQSALANTGRMQYGEL